jgi:hypothetical protein
MLSVVEWTSVTLEDVDGTVGRFEDQVVVPEIAGEGIEIDGDVGLQHLGADLVDVDADVFEKLFGVLDIRVPLAEMQLIEAIQQ